MDKDSRRARLAYLAPLAGRGRRVAPGEGDSQRAPLPENLLRQPLTPALSPQERGEAVDLSRRHRLRRPRDCQHDHRRDDAQRAGLSRTLLLSYLPAFFAAGALCIVAALTTLMISRVPKPVAA